MIHEYNDIIKSGTIKRFAGAKTLDIRPFVCFIIKNPEKEFSAMEFEKIIDRMEELVSSSFDRSYFSHLSDVQWKPPLDVYECENCILVVVELAGVRTEDVRVVIKGSEVAVSGIRRNVSPGKTEFTCHHMEMLCGRFSRKVALDPAVTGKTEVTYKDGLLNIKIYKEKK